MRNSVSTTNLPVIVNGGMGDLKKAKRMIAQAHCDFIAIGKDALASPDWPVKVRSGQQRRAFDFEMFSPLADLETANTYLSAHA